MYRIHKFYMCNIPGRYGPRQSKNMTYSEKGRLNVEVKFAPFSCKRRRAPIRVSSSNVRRNLQRNNTLSSSQDAEDRSVAVAIHQAIVASVRLELLPKSTIDVFLTIIENDGIEGCIAAGSIAASTALADAGIDMIGLVVACSGVSLHLISCDIISIRNSLWQERSFGWIPLKKRRRSPKDL